MSQVGSPPSTARPAPTAPAVTGAAVTPTPTDQATGNAPRHQGGGQPAPQQQPQPQAPAPPAPAVTLAGALTALFSGQPAKATVESTANGQVILRLPEAHLVIAAEAIEAARGDILVLKLAASGPNPAVIVTDRNGRPIADPQPVPITIEPVVEQPTTMVPPLPRRAVPPATLPAVLPPLSNLGTSPAQITNPPPAPLPTAPMPSAGSSPPPPQVPPAKPAVAAPNAPAAPPVLIDADLPPQAVETRPPAPAPGPRTLSLLQQVTQPLRAAPPAAVAAPPAPAPPAPPSTVAASADPRPVPMRDLPLVPQLPLARATATAPAQTQTSAEPDAPAALRPPAPAMLTTRTDGDAIAARPPSREPSLPAPLPMTPPPARQSAERPVPFVPPAIPPEALRPPTPQPNVALRPAPAPSPTLAPAPSLAHPQPEAAKVTQDSRPAAAAAAAPAKPAASQTTTAPTAPAEFVPIEVEPLPPPDAPLDRRAASAWNALWATARIDPVAAERIRDMLQPKAGGRLGGGLAFLVSALRGGKLAEWLGVDESARIDRPSRPTGMRTVDAEFRDLSRMAQERGPDGWRATPLAVLDGGAVQPVMLYVHRPPRRRKNDPKAGDASERFMLDLKLSRAGPMRIDGLLRPKALDVIVRTERSVPSRIQRDLRQVFTTSLEGAGLGGTLAFQKVDRLPPPPSMTADSKPHHAVLA